MLKRDFILQTTSLINRHLKENIIWFSKVIRLMKEELSGKIMMEFVALELKRYSYLTDANDKNKRGKAQESVS